MLRYVIAAQALRLFSLNNQTKKLYRRISNKIGNRNRGKIIPAHYIQRADENLKIIEKHGAIRHGMRVLELGTGWIHWESLFTRLFYDVEVIAFDVWDNRQFSGVLNYTHQLQKRLVAEVKRPPEQLERAQNLLSEIAKMRSFDELYEYLGFRYVISPSGSLNAIGDQECDLVYSSDVLEHVSVKAIPTLMRDLNRILKPGAYSGHQIVPWDHLAIYDKSVNGKNYLRYNDWVWSAFFQNDVQYFNRVQHSEWVKYFLDAGFEIIFERRTHGTDITTIKISERFRKYSEEDLENTVSHILVRKPVK